MWTWGRCEPGQPVGRSEPGQPVGRSPGRSTVLRGPCWEEGAASGEEPAPLGPGREDRLHLSHCARAELPGSAAVGPPRRAVVRFWVLLSQTLSVSGHRARPVSLTAECGAGQPVDVSGDGEGPGEAPAVAFPSHAAHSFRLLPVTILWADPLLRDGHCVWWCWAAHHSCLLPALSSRSARSVHRPSLHAWPGACC